MREIATVFLALIFETTPFLLLGVGVSVVGGPLITRLLVRSTRSHPVLETVAGTGAGLILPMCDCGSRPLAHRLSLLGKQEFAVSFMAASPVVNPITITTTWLAFRDIRLVVLRLGLAVLIALAAALVMGRFRSPFALTVPGASGPWTGSSEVAMEWRRMLPNLLDEFFELFPFLVVGSALAAAAQVFVKQGDLSGAHGILLGIGAMMALAFLLSICSSVDAFVVAGLGASLGLGPILAFLTFGPLINLKSVPMYLRLFSVPAVVVFTLLVTEVAFTGSLVAELRGW